MVYLNVAWSSCELFPDDDLSALFHYSEDCTVQVVQRLHNAAINDGFHQTPLCLPQDPGAPILRLQPNERLLADELCQSRSEDFHPS
jgi:hypothetical protein